ncbi:MAG: Do family serine endopeptidase [Chitinophagales bacterium]
MKYKLFPVIITAALTSVITLFAVSHFQRQVPYFNDTNTTKPVPVNYAAYSNNASANAGPVNFEPAAEASVKAVVHIKTTTNARTIIDNSNDMFSQLFGQRQYYIPSQQGSGSGVVISPDGYIVTNNHVVADANEVTVTFNDRYTTTAKVVGADPSTDIAVLKVEEHKSLPFMEFGNSDDTRLGQWVLAVGYPLSLDATVTAGIISAKGRSLGINKTQSASAIESFIQTDAAVNPGNSGGALVNTAGQLIGINSAIASPTGSYAGYSYAIPSNIVRKAVNDLMKYGSVQRAYMGIQYIDSKSLTTNDLEKLGISNAEGLYVASVVEKSGAAKAGIKKGDFIISINGETVSTQSELQEKIARYQPGDNVSVVYSRGGKEYTVTVQLTNIEGTTSIIKAESSAKLLGATFRPLSDKEKSNYNISGGVMVTDLGSGAIAKQTQMKKGFVITGINDEAIKSMNDLQSAFAGSKNLQIAGFYPGYQGMYYYGINNANVSE